MGSDDPLTTATASLTPTCLLGEAPHLEQRTTADLQHHEGLETSAARQAGPSDPLERRDQIDQPLELVQAVEANLYTPLAFTVHELDRRPQRRAEL